MTTQAMSMQEGVVLALALGAEKRESLFRDLTLFPRLRLVAADESDAELLAIASGAAEAERLASDALRRSCGVILEAPDNLSGLVRIAANGGRLMAPGRIGHTEVGKHLLAQLSEQRVGTLHSLYLAVRGPATSSSDNRFQSLVWDAVCLIDDCLNEPLPNLHVEGGALFGPCVDTAVVIARSASGTVVTTEVSCCLPLGHAPDGCAEVELEIMGGNATLRATPYSRCVSVRSSGDPLERFWGEDPLISMIRDWSAGGSTDSVRMQRRLGIGLAILNALDSNR
jgi:hypothetical protein